MIEYYNTCCDKDKDFIIFSTFGLQEQGETVTISNDSQIATAVDYTIESIR